MDFRIVAGISKIETIAPGSGIREIRRLRRAYGGDHWRKRKGTATIELRDGTIRTAEFHWYECHGVGSFEHKIKRYVD